MIELSDADVCPLGEFELAWRWTRAEQHLLEPGVLADIRPLTKQKALEFADDAVSRALPRQISEWDLTISAEWDDPDSVRARLRELFIPRNASVVVSWNRHVAVVTTWGTFFNNWDAFCYPSSDDVTVWYPGEAWTFVYHHFRVVEFRNRPGPA
jgi:hypothetical protein